MGMFKSIYDILSLCAERWKWNLSANVFFFGNMGMTNKNILTSSVFKFYIFDWYELADPIVMTAPDRRRTSKCYKQLKANVRGIRPVKSVTWNSLWSS